MKQRLKRLFPEVCNGWSELSGYHRFERLVSLVLTLAIAGAVLVAMYYLVIHVVQLLFIQSRDPFDYRVFQALFDMILTVLIAMEFMHSIVHWAIRGDSIIHLRTVLAIALLALARKYIILDPDDLSETYWHLVEREDLGTQPFEVHVTNGPQNTEFI